MILLDINVVSEAMRPRPDDRVMAWFARHANVALHLSAISEAELRAGLAVLPDGARRRGLETAFEAMMRDDFAGRCVAFDSAAARAYAAIAATRRLAGRPISTADCQIAAIAKARSYGLATRNLRDFEGCGVSLVDPWLG